MARKKSFCLVKLDLQKNARIVKTFSAKSGLEEIFLIKQFAVNVDWICNCPVRTAWKNNKFISSWEQCRSKNFGFIMFTQEFLVHLEHLKIEVL